MLSGKVARKSSRHRANRGGGTSSGYHCCSARRRYSCPPNRVPARSNSTAPKRSALRCSLMPTCRRTERSRARPATRFGVQLNRHSQSKALMVAPVYHRDVVSMSGYRPTATRSEGHWVPMWCGTQCLLWDFPAKMLASTKGHKRDSCRLPRSASAGIRLNPSAASRSSSATAERVTPEGSKCQFSRTPRQHMP